jgi:hypothetical protein
MQVIYESTFCDGVIINQRITKFFVATCPALSNESQPIIALRLLRLPFGQRLLDHWQE